MRKMFRNGDIALNDFMSKAIHRDEMPELWSELDNELAAWVVNTQKPLKPVDALKIDIDSGIRPQKMEFQCHTISVAEHIDDVQAGIFFQIYVISTTPMVPDGTPGISPALLSYIDDQGRRRTARMIEGTSAILNPRRTHSMTYYGHSPLIALRSVIRAKARP